MRFTHLLHVSTGKSTFHRHRFTFRSLHRKSMEARAVFCCSLSNNNPTVLLYHSSKKDVFVWYHLNREKNSVIFQKFLINFKKINVSKNKKIAPSVQRKFEFVVVKLVIFYVFHYFFVNKQGKNLEEKKLNQKNLISFYFWNNCFFKSN